MEIILILRKINKFKIKIQKLKYFLNYSIKFALYFREIIKLPLIFYWISVIFSNLQYNLFIILFCFPFILEYFNKLLFVFNHLMDQPQYEDLIFKSIFPD